MRKNSDSPTGLRKPVIITHEDVIIMMRKDCYVEKPPLQKANQL